MATKPQQQTTVLELPHDLTPDELLGLQKKIMGLLDNKEELEDELESAEAEFKSAKADVAKRTKDLDAEIKKVRDAIKMGRETRKYPVNIMRDRDARKTEYVVSSGPRAGDVVKVEDFTQQDWDAILEESEPELPFPDTDDNEQPDLRAQADLTAEPELGPDKDENDRVVAGPNTDAYNIANPGDTTYQHLSGDANFAPASISVSHPEWDAEMQAMYNTICQQIAGFDLEQAKGMLAIIDEGHPTKTLLPDAVEVQTELRKVVQARIETLTATEPTDAADVDRDDLPASVTDEFESNDSADDSDDDEPSEDDETQTPAPKVPKRPANRRK